MKRSVLKGADLCLCLGKAYLLVCLMSPARGPCDLGQKASGSRSVAGLGLANFYNSGLDDVLEFLRGLIPGH